MDNDKIPKCYYFECDENGVKSVAGMGKHKLCVKHYNKKKKYDTRRIIRMHSRMG